MQRSIKTNTIINIAGQAIPVLVALFAIPKVIHGLGTDRFGILTLAWLVIGYFSLFDLGLGRALTQIIADRKHRESSETLATTAWTAMAIMTAMGLVGAAIAAYAAPALATYIFKVPLVLQSETITTFYVLAAAIPLVVISAGLVGLLTAYDRFDLINFVRIPLGISNFAIPLAMLPFTNNLVLITIALVACRLLAALVQSIFCFQTMPALQTFPRFNPSDVSALFRFGGWMSVTNIVGPLMVYFDRFLIGATVTVTAVAYYATPYEMATKLLILPGAVSATLFPRFASLHLIDVKKTLDLLIRGWEFVLVLLFPPVLLIVVTASEGLQLWLGKDFASNSTAVLQWLSIGILFNALAHLPFAFLQGAGRPDLSAKAHFVELVIYLPILWWALEVGNIKSAAQVWAARTLLDCILLSGLACRILPGFKDYLIKTMPWLLITACALVGITLASDLSTRLCIGFVGSLFATLLLAKLSIAPTLKALTRRGGIRAWINS